MSKTQTVKAKPTPTAKEAFAAVRFQLIGMNFVYHTICRLITQKMGCEFSHAEKIADSLIDAGLVVPAYKIGLTELQTFKLSDQ